jgi:uncharacterized protein (TIGR03083 family)
MAPKPLGPVLTVHLFPEERRLLLELLGTLAEEEWDAPTVCPGWSVKDIALHLLGDDLGRLSRGRDDFAGAASCRGRGHRARTTDFINDWNSLSGQHAASARDCCATSFTSPVRKHSATSSRSTSSRSAGR